MPRLIRVCGVSKIVGVVECGVGVLVGGAVVHRVLVFVHGGGRRPYILLQPVVLLKHH